MRRIVEKSLGARAWVLAGDVGADVNSPLLAQILSNRGIIGDDAVQKFLNPSIKEYMPDPSALRDMDAAARIIADAVIAGKKIAVYGDYDVDGITATAVFVKYLRAIGVDVIWHLPTREGEGYGLNIPAIEDLAAAGANLLITVDCGISGVAEVARAKQLGMDVVITDHHSVDGNIPDAGAVVNPKRADDNSGLSYLAGVGVAFMTVVAVNRELKRQEIRDQRQAVELLDYLDLVALGTICDTMPLIGLNRAFAATGLKVLNARKNLGLRVLMDVAGIKTANTYSVMFGIGPRLNAAGRLSSATPALELLLTDNVLIAGDLANRLNKMNSERIDVQNAIMLAADEIAAKIAADKKCSLFVCGDEWRTGVMGIIAGRLKDKYNMPTCVATKSDGVIDGSGRSIVGVDLGRIIHSALARGIITGGGGHAAAAGFSLNADREDEFKEFLEEEVVRQLDGVLPNNEITVDAQMNAAGATLDVARELSRLEPFGQDNPEPVIVLTGASLMFATVMGNGSHLRGSVRTARGQLNFVGFNMVASEIGNFLLDDANINTSLMMLGKIKENEYQGRVSVQFVLEDVAV